MNLIKDCKLHTHACQLLNLLIAADEKEERIKTNYKKWKSVTWDHPIRLMNKENYYTDGLNRLPAIRKRIIGSYNNVMIKLYNQDYAKTENLWQTLNALQMLFPNGGETTVHLLNDVKKVLNDNRP